jgi:hypothetical protein
MITPNQYPIVQDVWEETLIRVEGLREGENMDLGTFMRQLNWAVREVYLDTLGYKGWTYKESATNLRNGDRIDRRFLESIRVLVSESGEDGSFFEARYADPREFFTVTSTLDYPQIWGRGRSLSPIYTLWGNRDYITAIGQPQLFIYFQPDTLIGMMDAYMAPPEVNSFVDVVPIPNDFIEYFMQNVIVRILTVIGRVSEAQDIVENINQTRASFKSKHQERQTLQKRKLESFVQPIHPIVPPKEEPGEVPNKLV